MKGVTGASTVLGKMTPKARRDKRLSEADARRRRENDLRDYAQSPPDQEAVAYMRAAIASAREKKRQ